MKKSSVFSAHFICPLSFGFLYLHCKYLNQVAVLMKENELMTEVLKIIVP